MEGDTAPDTREQRAPGEGVRSDIPRNDLTSECSGGQDETRRRSARPQRVMLLPRADDY